MQAGVEGVHAAFALIAARGFVEQIKAGDAVVHRLHVLRTGEVREGINAKGGDLLLQGHRQGRWIHPQFSGSLHWRIVWVQTTISGANILDADLLMELLTGAELIAHNKAHSSVKVAAQLAGYVKVLPDGRQRVLLAKYRDALLAAAGVAPIGKAPSKGRPLSFRTKVLNAGHAVIGTPYLAQAGLEPGDEVEIKVNRGRIVLSGGAE
jgi:hypothetical protein